jgi:hypothetical protein
MSTFIVWQVIVVLRASAGVVDERACSSACYRGT